MKFYLYPIERISIEKLSEVHWHFFSKWVKEAYLSLAKHNKRTLDPSKADFFIISLSLFTFKFVKFNTLEIENKIKKLLYIDSKKPHIFFDFSNSDSKLIDHQNLVYFKSAMNKNNYNINKDVSIPYFPLYIFDDDDIEKSSERLVLASFRGDLKNKLRKRLNKYSTVDLVIKDSTIIEFEIDEELNYKVLNHENLESYVNLLENSQFTIIPYGSSIGLSYRFIETLSKGSIPVIISDNLVLPFNDLLNYNNFTVTVKEKSLKNLEDNLKKINNLDNLQKNALLIYNTYFSSINKIISTSLMIYEMKCGKFI